jgi:LysM repeat protein
MHLRFRDARRSEGDGERAKHDVTRAAFPVSANFARRSPLGAKRRKQSQFRISNRLPFAAAPALLGVAAAITLSAQSASPAAAAVTTPRVASADQSSQLTSAELLAAIHPAAALPATGKHAKSTARRYTVRNGDTLSSIAGKVYHDPGAWPVLYWANRDKIRWANSVEIGQVLTVPVKPAKIPAAPSQLDPAPAPVQASPAASAEAASEPQAAVAEPAATASTYSGSGSFQSCVISRESGGNSQVMNSSGHYGLYQFSSSTWAAYGGDPAEFGDASVAEQNQVFDNAIAAGGQSNWAPYDGC